MSSAQIEPSPGTQIQENIYIHTYIVKQHNFFTSFGDAEV